RFLFFAESPRTHAPPAPRTTQTGQFQSPQLARTAIGWSQSPQQRNGGLSLLANAGHAHSSFTRDRRTPPSRGSLLHALFAPAMSFHGFPRRDRHFPHAQRTSNEFPRVSTAGQAKARTAKEMATVATVYLSSFTHQQK
ncbi:hypothetical protein KI387_012558, partial [Taxus chinensis]